MAKYNLYDQLVANKNPLDKKFRWEINVAFKEGRITNEQRVSLLKVSDKDLEDLVQCIANKVPVDKAQVGNYYYKRALYIFKQRKKRATTVKLDKDPAGLNESINDLTGQGYTKPLNFSK